MSDLTKEYFDKHITAIEKRFDSVNKRFDVVEHKVDGLGHKVDGLEHKIDDEVAALATMITNGFEDIIKRLDVRDRVEKLENKMTKVETALNVRL